MPSSPPGPFPCSGSISARSVFLQYCHRSGGKTVTREPEQRIGEVPVSPPGPSLCFWQRAWGMGRPRPRTEETLPAPPLGCALSCWPCLLSSAPTGSCHHPRVSYCCTIPPTAVGRAGHRPQDICSRNATESGTWVSHPSSSRPLFPQNPQIGEETQ